MSAFTFKSVENKQHPQLRLNSICPYFTMFPLSFPMRILSKVKPGEVVFDPCCGRGTTNFAARLLGNTSYGIDSNPVAQAVAQSKLVSVKSKDITTVFENIVNSSTSSKMPKGEFWELAFHPDTLHTICQLREYFMLKENLSHAEVALRAIILGVLHGPRMKSKPSYLSNQFPRTFSLKPGYSIKYWKREKLVPQLIDTKDLITRKAEYFYNDHIPQHINGNIILGDSRFIEDINGEKFDWIITSPPYFGMSTYRQDQWLRLWFLGGSENVDYSNNEQIKHWSEKSFIKDLSLIWRNTAKMANKDAKLIIRFGAIPSCSNIPPRDILKESIKLSDCGWSIKTIKSAGIPVSNKRQANQLRNSNSKYIEEFDLYAVLNN